MNESSIASSNEFVANLYYVQGKKGDFISVCKIFCSWKGHEGKDETTCAALSW